jgi:hypothetical protein
MSAINLVVVDAAEVPTCNFDCDRYDCVVVLNPSPASLVHFATSNMNMSVSCSVVAVFHGPDCHVLAVVDTVVMVYGVRESLHGGAFAFAVAMHTQIASTLISKLCEHYTQSITDWLKSFVPAHATVTKFIVGDFGLRTVSDGFVAYAHAASQKYDLGNVRTVKGGVGIKIESAKRSSLVVVSKQDTFHGSFSAGPCNSSICIQLCHA